MITTAPVNLVPAPRRIDRRRRARVKIWCAAASGYSVVLVALFVVFQTMAGTAVQSVDAELDHVNTEINATNTKIAALQPKLAESKLTLQASRAVENQPDWSVLIALLTSRLNERVVLSYCSLSPERSASGGAAPAVPRVVRGGAATKNPPTNESPKLDEYRIDVRGMAKTQAALSAFVLELERADLFEKVLLKDAKRMKFVDSDAIEFQIVCTLLGGQASP